MQTRNISPSAWDDTRMLDDEERELLAEQRSRFVQGRTPRKRNPFIFFRSQYNKDTKDRGQHHSYQDNVSRYAGDAWNMMNEEERRPYVVRAAKEAYIYEKYFSTDKSKDKKKAVKAGKLKKKPMVVKKRFSSTPSSRLSASPILRTPSPLLPDLRLEYPTGSEHPEEEKVIADTCPITDVLDSLYIDDAFDAKPTVEELQSTSLILPMRIEDGSPIKTHRPSPHDDWNFDTVQPFLPIDFDSPWYSLVSLPPTDNFGFPREQLLSSGFS